MFQATIVFVDAPEVGEFKPACGPAFGGTVRICVDHALHLLQGWRGVVRIKIWDAPIRTLNAFVVLEGEPDVLREMFK